MYYNIEGINNITIYFINISVTIRLRYFLAANTGFLGGQKTLKTWNSVNKYFESLNHSQKHGTLLLCEPCK